MTLLAPLLERFFTQRLLHQRRASSHTIAAYRDAFRLLLKFIDHQRGKAPSQVALADLDADLLVAFLAHLEKDRNNVIRSRNARLAAIHSFFRYVAFEEPGHSAAIQRVLAIPYKRAERKLVEFLGCDEIEALLDAPERSTVLGRRDYTLLLFAIQTGLRVSELTQLRWQDVRLDSGAHVRSLGKGRKDRSTPLTAQSVAALRLRQRELTPLPSDPVFPSRRGGPMSRDAVERLVTKHAALASSTCPSLKNKNVSPHTLRHTSAMQLLAAGVDRTVLALWLGHESIETTEVYVHADLAIKERAIARTAPLPCAAKRYKPADRLLAFLEGL
jgi:site-specific recombinase XerD